MNTQYSTLMSVYKKECAEHLENAMDSIWNQTVATNDFVLICDGPLNPELDSVISKMKQKHPKTLNVIRLNKNGGLGNALNIGLRYCKNELIARMDSDDISRPDRCEKQLVVFNNSPDVDICSGIVEEFTESVRGEKEGFSYANVENYLYKVRIREGNTGTTNGLKQRKAKEYVQHINSNQDDNNHQLDYQDAITCTKDEIVKYERAYKHLNIAIHSRKKPLKLAAYTLLSMLESKYIFKYILEAVILRLLVISENKRFPRSIDSL